MNKKIFCVFIILLLTYGCNSNKNHMLYKTTSDAMSPNINPGDLVIMDTATNDFTYGDMVSYKFEGNEYVKAFEDVFRIVALPEDSFATENEICIINQKKDKAEYIQKGRFFREYEEELPNGLKINIYYYPLEEENADQKPIKIPKSHYFLLCDSRTGAIDSRYFGPVYKDKITGKVIKVIKGDE